MRVVVVGAGAMGSVLGGLLALGGADVSFVDPYEAHMKAIRENGLMLTVGGELRNISGIQTFLTPQEALDHGNYDLELLMVKASMSRQALEQTACLRSPVTRLISFQNGLGHLEGMKEFVPAENILYGCLNISGRLTSPGQAECTVINPALAIQFGCCSETVENAASADALEAVFCGSGLVNAVFTREIETCIWNKVMVNCAVNPLSAILKMTGPEMAGNRDLRSMMVRVAEETGRVAQAAGIPGVDSGHFCDTVLPSIQKGPNHYSSMANDICAGKKTEIAQMNGAVSEYGRRCHVPTPLNDMLTAMILAIEAGYAHDPVVGGEGK